MSQQPQSAKRMRSNTSNEFTPQTAPALRTRPPPSPLSSNNNHNSSSANDDNAAAVAAAASIGLYSPIAYDGSFGALPTARQDVPYDAYASATTSQHNGYPSMAYAESYSPHPHPHAQGNSYTIAYGHPPPTSHNPSHAALYAPSLVGSTHNGSYSPVSGRQSSSAGPDVYSPSPIPGNTSNNAYPEVQGHSMSSVPRQSLHPSYDDAYSPHPVLPSTPYHGQAMSYPDPPVPSSIERVEMQMENASLDSSSEADLGSDEDAQGETADEADPNDLSQMVHSESSSQILPTPPLPAFISSKKGTENESSKLPDSKCACKKGRGKKKACTSCACSKYGRKCSKACSCGTACGNPFQDLTTFFGSTNQFPKNCDANACFATWLSNQPNIEELDLDLMVDMLLYDDTSWATIKEYTKPFKEWEDKWLKAKNAKSKKMKEDRQRLELELLRGALGNCNPNDFHGFWYSFCRSQWVPMDDWEHCRECKMCTSSSEWHCEQHGKCTANRVCTGCMGDAPQSSR